MLHTNLLPKEEIKTITIEKSLCVIKFFGISIIGTLVVGTTLLAPSYLPLYFQNKEFKHALSVQQEAAQRINEGEIASDALHIQAIIASLRQTEGNSHSALDMFNLLTTEQSGVVVSEFTINGKTNITISGNANTRNDLLAFEQRLRDSSRFQDIASPLVYIIQETNINFNLNGTLKSQFAL